MGSDGYIPELALVAEETGEILGHIMLSKTYILTGKNRVEALILAPLSVIAVPSQTGYRLQTGARKLPIAKQMGFQSVFVVGTLNIMAVLASNPP